MATSRKLNIKLNIGKINQNIKMLEEKKKSIEQNIQQLRKARGKLVENLQNGSKNSETKKLMNKIIVNDNFKTHEHKNSDLDEKLLLDFLDDSAGDDTILEATEVAENENISAVSETFPSATNVLKINSNWNKKHENVLIDRNPLQSTHKNWTTCPARDRVCVQSYKLDNSIPVKMPEKSVRSPSLISRHMWRGPLIKLGENGEK